MRIALRVLLVVVVIAGVPAVAMADETLEDYLEEAARAEFHGRGVVLCSWGPDSAGATYEVTRSGGMSMVHGPGGDLMIGGSLTATRSGSDWYGLEVSEWSAWTLSSRYTVSEPMRSSRLGRPASIVTVLEDGRPRARMIIDDASTVPLLTEILDGDGNVFRLAAMIEFEAGSSPAVPEVPEMHEKSMVMPVADAGDLPATAAGYRRADTYGGPEGSIQAFYTDGLFSFSVFESKRSGTPHPFENATTLEVGDERYQRIITPSHVWIHWDAPDRSYVMVGDLPPDHVAAVLAELPEPGDRSLFVRMWRRLFG